MKRIISKIQIKDNFQVQTIQFEGLRKIGDIHNSILNMYNHSIKFDNLKITKKFPL
tara:strand:- start:100 stop:267 length:168 start_codon:yes stop_codon:yes gene_type:complete